MNAPRPSIFTEFFLSIESHTGRAGFEGLVVRLCEVATGQRFRMASSGLQHGSDAQTEKGYGNTIKVEAKHYLKTSLNRRELIAELSEATGSTSEVDLWVLATSAEIKAQLAAELERIAADNHAEVLILDCGAGDLPRLVVMMAAFPDVVEDWIKQNNYTFNTSLLRDALKTLTSNSSFTTAWAAIKSKLSSTLLGYEDARARSRLQFLKVMGDPGAAEASLAQPVSMLATNFHNIPRQKISNDLLAWWKDFSDGRQSAAVLGEEGTGKTWAVYSWITSQVEADIMPIFLPFSATAESISSGETIASFLPKLLAKWAGFPNQEQWGSRIDRWIACSGGMQPLFLIFADGLNQKPWLDWPMFFNPLREERWRKYIAVLITDRPGHWGPYCARSGLDDFRQIQISGYTNWELQQALKKKDVPLSAIPEELQELIRTPKYCELICEHFEEMKRSADFTIERLIYIDIVSRRRGVMTEDVLIEIIKNLAERYRRDSTIPLSDIQKVLPGADPEGRIYQEIIDGGILVRAEGLAPKYIVERKRLVFGLGMLVSEEVKKKAQAERNSAKLERDIAEWFEPERDMDLKVEISGAALFHALIDVGFPAIGRRELLRYWLSLRNWQDTAQQAFRDYVVRCPDDFIAVTEEFWSGKRDSGAAQEFLSGAFVKHREHPSLQPLLVNAISRWMGFIHPCGHPFFRQPNHRKQQLRSEIEERVGFPLRAGQVEICRELFTVVDDDALLRLKRFGFRIISAGPREPFVSCFTKWAVASAVMGHSIESDVADWVIHLAEDEPEHALALEAQKLLESETPIGVRAARTLFWWADRRKAEKLWQQNSNPEYVYWQQKHDADPCTSLTAWSDADCAQCMQRPDISIHMILGRIDQRCLDPKFQVPWSLIDRVHVLLKLDPFKYCASRWRTSDDHMVREAFPLLSSRSPKELADFLRRVLSTLPLRDQQGSYPMLVSLPDLSMLFGEAEIEIISKLQDKAQSGLAQNSATVSNFIDDQSLGEAFAFLSLAPHFAPAERLRKMLRRPENARDLFRLEPWFQELPNDEERLALDIVRMAAEELTVIRSLWFLAGNVSQLMDVDRNRIISLAESNSGRLRGAAMRFAYMSDDIALGQKVCDISLRCDYDPNSWDSIWGPRVVMRYSRHLAFETLVMRLHPAELGDALMYRDFPVEEVKAYAQLLDSCWEQIASAANPSLPLPMIHSGPRPPVPRSHFPQFVDEDTSVSFRDPHLTWGTERVHEAVSQDFLDPEATVQKRNRLSRERVEVIKTAWKTDALQWFGRGFNRSALEHVYRAFPHLIMKWVDPVLEGGKLSKILKIRLGTFLVEICSILLDDNRTSGLELWHVLHSKHQGPLLFNAAYTAFAARDNAQTAKARQEILRDAHNDEALSKIAFFASQNGKTDWLHSAIEKLLLEPRLWKKAKGLTLASFSHISIEQLDSYIARAKVHATWFESQLEWLRGNVRRNEFAKHWFELFLDHPDADVSWGALQMFLKSADLRFFNWSSAYDPSLTEQRMHRSRYLESQSDSIERDLDHDSERQRTLFGIKIPRGEVFPFVSA